MDANKLRFLPAVKSNNRINEILGRYKMKIEILLLYFDISLKMVDQFKILYQFWIKTKNNILFVTNKNVDSIDKFARKKSYRC
jgi:hypothetical protein